MTCEEFKNALYKTDPLECSRALRAAVYRHLKDCLDCRRLMEAEAIRVANVPDDVPDSEFEKIVETDFDDQEFIDTLGPEPPKEDRIIDQEPPF